MSLRFLPKAKTAPPDQRLPSESDFGSSPSTFARDPHTRDSRENRFSKACGNLFEPVRGEISDKRCLAMAFSKAGRQQEAKETLYTLGTASNQGAFRCRWSKRMVVSFRSSAGSAAGRCDSRILSILLPLAVDPDRL